MTNDEMIAVITAHKDGKQIQYRRNRSSDWEDCYDNEPTWNFYVYNYRVKPVNVYRPFANEEEYQEAIKKHVGGIIVHADENGRIKVEGEFGDMSRVYDFLLANCVWADDGTPCGVGGED